MWGWFSLRRKVSTESYRTVQSLSKEQLHENLVTPAHRPHRVIHEREGEKEEEEEEEVRGDRKRL